MNRNLYNLFLGHQEKIAQVRGIKTSGLVDAHEINKLESRATLLTLLDARLFEHRKKYATPFSNLSGKRGLEHLILTKYRWTLEQIRNLSLADALLTIQEELTYQNSVADTQAFLDHRYWDTMINHFDDFLEDEWDPELAAQYLKWRPWKDHQ